MKNKLIVILGPTATGKSDFAVRLAKKMKYAEIISADSRQVYKGLDIGSGKITKKEMRGIPHHLLDVADPKKVFSVSDYQKLANKVIADIISRGNTPILVGGTGLYIDAVVYGTVFPEVPPNKTLRKKLESKTVRSLFKILQKLDAARAKTIDAQNPVRLIRAIEIAKALGKVPAFVQKEQYDAEFIGLTLPDDVLKKKIHNRLLARMKIGMVREVSNLHKKGLSWKRLESFGLEYRSIAQYLQKNPPAGGLKKEMLIELEKAIWQYTKRQMTWFKRNKKIKWIKPR